MRGAANVPRELLKRPGRRKASNDGACGQLVYFTVARNGLCHAGQYVSVDVMPAALPHEFAAFFIESADEVEPLHAYSIWPTLRRVS